MVQYRRNYVPGGTYFFTVTLADRRSSALVEHIPLLRAAFRVTRKERPFTINAIVILPDHLHTIMTLPPDDADFSGRWRRIKSLFTRRVVAGGAGFSTTQKANTDFGRGDSGSTQSATKRISAGSPTTSTTTRFGTAW